MMYLVMTQFGNFKEKIHIQDYVFPYILHYFIKIYYYLQLLQQQAWRNRVTTMDPSESKKVIVKPESSRHLDWLH